MADGATNGEDESELDDEEDDADGDSTTLPSFLEETFATMDSGMMRMIKRMGGIKRGSIVCDRHTHSCSV